MTGHDMWRVCIRAGTTHIVSRTAILYTREEAERAANHFNYFNPYWAPFRATHHAHAWVERASA